MDDNKDVRDDFKDGNERLKDPGWRGRPEEPWFRALYISIYDKHGIWNALYLNLS